MVLWHPPKRGSVGPSMKGSHYSYERYGKWYVSSWPKPRGKPRSEKQKQAQELFSECCRVMKLTAAEIQMYHAEAAKGTPMLPRDTLMAAYYGKGPTLRFYNGRILKPMSNRLLASTTIDALAWTKGDILVRGDEYWEAIAPGAEGTVLTAGAPGELPLYLPPSGGGGNGGQWFIPGYPIERNDFRRTYGTSMWANMPFTVPEILFNTRDAGTYTLQAKIYLMSGDDLVTELCVSNELTKTGIAHEPWKLQFSTTPTFEPPNKYCVVIFGGNTAGGTTWRLMSAGPDSTSNPFDRGTFRFDSGSLPSEGLTMNPITNGSNYSGLKWIG